MSQRLNIAQRLSHSAIHVPSQKAVVCANGRDNAGRVIYSHLTFRQLEEESHRLAQGLTEMGIMKGTRIVLMVPPSLEFIALTFALFKTGAVIILIDPGMGRSNIFRCLKEIEPQGFVAIPLVHLIRKFKRFPEARYNVTVGKKSFWNQLPTYQDLLQHDPTKFEIAPTTATDPAAIIFTSGSTGTPKGVHYEHGMFDAQVELLREYYQIKPGEVDLSGFPLFALFNAAMQVTTVIPEMDPTKPAQVDPTKILQAIEDLGVTQAFGSPALWNRVGRYCEQTNRKIPYLKRVLSAGAPVPLPVIKRMHEAFSEPEADIYTPYGATESLPVCSVSGKNILRNTAEKSRQGAGTFVGETFPQVKVKIIKITQGPISSLEETCPLPAQEIGEIIVQAPSTTREYFRRPEATALAKIPEGNQFWHRMGDVGYLDEQGGLWFCGRKDHIVHTTEKMMFTIPCEAIFNQHPKVYRSALVGIGSKPNQTPLIIVEPESDHFPQTEQAKKQFTQELLELGEKSSLTSVIRQVLFHPQFPVDIRHNVKIFREKLAQWAADQ